MIFLAGAAAVCALIRFAAPYVKDFAADMELNKPGMRYWPKKEVPPDGIWLPEEIPAVLNALNGKGSTRILEIGEERIQAAIRGGCAVCPNQACKKIFPKGAPATCDRCACKFPPPKG
jgi:hypothetical protein